MRSSFPKCQCGKYTEQNGENVCFAYSIKLSGCVQMDAFVIPFFGGGCWFCTRLQRMVSQCCKDTLNNCIGFFFFISDLEAKSVSLIIRKVLCWQKSQCLCSRPHGKTQTTLYPSRWIPLPDWKLTECCDVSDFHLYSSCYSLTIANWPNHKAGELSWSLV